MQPHELKVGQVFKYGTKEVKIHANLTDGTTLFSVDNNPRLLNMPSDIFCQSIKDWELVSEFKRDPTYSDKCKPTCRHTNIREDRFFSAMVYKTCKDCGKSLN